MTYRSSHDALVARTESLERALAAANEKILTLQRRAPFADLALLEAGSSAQNGRDPAIDEGAATLAHLEKLLSQEQETELPETTQPSDPPKLPNLADNSIVVAPRKPRTPHSERCVAVDREVYSLVLRFACLVFLVPMIAVGLIFAIQGAQAGAVGDLQSFSTFASKAVQLLLCALTTSFFLLLFSFFLWRASRKM